MLDCKFATIPLPNSSYIYDLLGEFNRIYGQIHGYLSIVLCLFGIFANSLNVTVLTRSALRTPVNAILCLIAICNLVVTILYTVYLGKFFFVPKRCLQSDFSYAWAVFVLAFANTTFIGHSASLWLGVQMALMRYMVLRRKGSRRGLTVHNYRISLIQGLILMAAIMVANIPMLLSFKVIEAPIFSIQGATCPQNNDTEELYGKC